MSMLKARASMYWYMLTVVMSLKKNSYMRLVHRLKLVPAHACVCMHRSQDRIFVFTCVIGNVGNGAMYMYHTHATTTWVWLQYIVRSVHCVYIPHTLTCSTLFKRLVQWHMIKTNMALWAIHTVQACTDTNLVPLHLMAIAFMMSKCCYAEATC